jgi:BASS family bile acid:Na+ symporter
MTGSKLAARLAHFIHKYFIVAIISSYIAAALVPQFGLWMRTVDFGFLFAPKHKISFTFAPLMLASLLFNAGLGVALIDLRETPRKAFMMFAGFFGNVVAPLIMILSVSLTMKLWHDPEETQQLLVGLALVASMPIAGASTAWTQNANGSLVLSLGLVLLTTLLSPLTTPLILHAVGFLTIDDYSEDLHELGSGEAISFLGSWVIIPSLLGLMTRQLIGSQRFVSAIPYVKLANFVVIMLLNYTNATLVLPKVVSQPDVDFLFIILFIVSALCIGGFACGFLLSRAVKAERQDAVSLIFALGMNNNGTGLVLASIALEDHPRVLLPILLYNFIQYVIASLVDLGLPNSGSGMAFVRGADKAETDVRQQGSAC